MYLSRYFTYENFILEYSFIIHIIYIYIQCSLYDHIVFPLLACNNMKPLEYPVNISLE